MTLWLNNNDDTRNKNCGDKEVENCGDKEDEKYEIARFGVEQPVQ